MGGIQTQPGGTLDLHGDVMTRLFAGQYAGHMPQLSVRAQLLDHQEDVKAVDLTRLFLAGNITFDADKASRVLQSQWLYSDQVDYFNDRIAMYMRVSVAGEVYDVPLGIFLWKLPQETISQTVTVLDVEGLDKLQLLADYSFTSPKLIERSTNLLQAVRELCLDPEADAHAEGVPPLPLIDRFNFPSIPRQALVRGYYCGVSEHDYVGAGSTATSPNGQFDLRFRIGSLDPAKVVSAVRIVSSPTAYGWDTGGGLYWAAHLVVVDATTVDLYCDHGTLPIENFARETFDFLVTYTDSSTVDSANANQALPIYGPTLAAPHDIVFDPGKNLLEAINELLIAAAFGKAYCNRLGELCLRPLDADPSDLIPPVTYENGPYSVIEDPVVRSFDDSKLANQVVCVGETVDNVAVRSDVFQNLNPHSPISIPRRGRIVSRLFKESGVYTKYALDLIASNRLSLAAQVTEQVQIKTIPDPRREAFDTYYLAIHQNGEDIIKHVYTVKSWNLALRLDSMSHTVTKVTSLDPEE